MPRGSMSFGRTWSLSAKAPAGDLAAEDPSPAYEHQTYAEEKSALLQVRKDLTVVNQFAVRNLDKRLEEMLALHRLGLFP